MRRLTNGLLWLALALLLVAVGGLGCQKEDPRGSLDHRVTDLELRMGRCEALYSLQPEPTRTAYDEHCTMEIAMVRPCHMNWTHINTPTPTPLTQTSPPMCFRLNETSPCISYFRTQWDGWEVCSYGSVDKKRWIKVRCETLEAK